MEFPEIRDKLLGGDAISEEEALALAGMEGAELLDLFALANRLRERHSGNAVRLCSIINAKSGSCGEDCSFCAQSSHYSTGVETFSLVGGGEIVKAALKSRDAGAIEFSIVTSGYGIEDEGEVEEVSEAIAGVRERAGMMACVSPGVVSERVLRRFKNSGLTYYHHNLETARSFFPNICSTHDYEDDVKTVRLAKSLGLKVCCGGIFGLGESWGQRVELFGTMRELGVDSAPLNFLNPIAGTPMEGARALNPMECLRIIAVARAMMPDADIHVCGGREVNLRDFQGMMFFAGANGTMAGNYLTTTGRPPEEDLRMIKDAGLEVAKT